ncbi:hypothetical protein LZ198_11640 [Myxococcus sp. K15C18031901]|uniref:hypothetical protein n=1 Tax=Myxococcus dinghuensis TaxID=2906761 RepID=UPI0020A82BE4|nr:hypothetical protein [Myxococcus dinghuensis]MCP3099522.1 hypothetical protein [Myxococcus dinghuensis]
MSADQRARRMVGYLPAVLQSGSKLQAFFSTLALELEQMESGLTRLMRSRWYSLARGFPQSDLPTDKADSELGRVAALYGLTPRRGESEDYFREHLAALVELHRTGLASAPALLRLASMVYMARQPPDITWEGDVAVGTFTVLRADGTPRTVRLELVDNPRTRAVASFRNVGAAQRLLTNNGGLETELPQIALRATEREIAVPILHQVETGLDFIFLGRVPLGSTLTLNKGRPPFIDGHPVSQPLIVANPTRFAGPDNPSAPARFNAPTARFSVFSENDQFPEMVPGETHWTYDTLDRQQVRSYLLGWSAQRQDEAVAQALEQRNTPRADLRFDWSEVTPATCTLRIPVDYIPLHLQLRGEDLQVPGLPGLIQELTAAMEYGRAAGVTARIELTLPMPPEALIAREGPLNMDITTRFTMEEFTVKDALASFGSTIDLHDTFDPPREELSWDGVFDATRFDTSRFKP